MQLVKQRPRIDEAPESDSSVGDFPDVGLAGQFIGVCGSGEGIYVETVSSEAWSRSRVERSTGDTVAPQSRNNKMEYETVNVHLVSHLVPEKGTHPRFDVALAPPEGESLDEATTVVHSDEELVEYILELARCQGPWKRFTKNGWEALARASSETVDSANFAGI